MCGTAFDTGNILLDRRLRASMKHHTTTGWGLCPKHQRLFSEGFVALVECDPQRSGTPSGSGLMKPDQAYRTGRLAHLKRDAFARASNAPLAADHPCVPVQLRAIEQLQAMVPATD